MNYFSRLSGTFVKSLCINSHLYPSIAWYRNTFILKRRFPPEQSKIGVPKNQLKRLKGRHHIYDVVEDTNQAVSPDFKVVLTTFVEGIGDVGDVISLMPHYARQHLLLPGKAVYATPENIETFSLLKKTRPDRPIYSSIHAGMTIRRLNKSVIPVIMNSEQPWTVETKHIQIAFRMEGFIVPADGILIPESHITGPDPLKEGKDFAIFLTINNTEQFPVRCRIVHVKGGSVSAKLPEECYLNKSEPVLEEQLELLNSMEEPEIRDDSPASNVSLIEKYRIVLIE